MTAHGRQHGAAPAHGRAPIIARLAATLEGLETSLQVISAQQVHMLDLTRQLLQQRGGLTSSGRQATAADPTRERLSCRTLALTVLVSGDADHEFCRPGCLQLVDPQRVRARAYAAKVAPADLAALVDLGGGLCMICRRCHANVVDVDRTGTVVRGVVCRWCRTRLSVADGAIGNLAAASAADCRCAARTDEARARLRKATARYLSRADVPPSRSDRRGAFANLVDQVRHDGADRAGVWSTATDDIPTRFWTQAIGPTVERFDGAALERPQCPPLCMVHQQHVYVACYGTPTHVRDADVPYDHRVTHYVGWTSQQPPGKRLRQHGPATPRCLVVLVPGDKHDETIVKGEQNCPRCHQPLWYKPGPPPPTRESLALGL